MTSSMNRSIAFIAVLAALALSAAPSLAGDGPGNGTMPPPCPPGQFPSQAAPCMPPLCAEGVMPSQTNPCMPPPCAAGQNPQPNAPCVPQGGGFGPGPGGPPNGNPGGPPNGNPGGPPNAGPGGPPPLESSFLNRVWRFNAEADAYDAAANILNVTVIKITNLPKAMADQDDEIVDQDAYVLFTGSTKVYDQNGKRVPKETKYDGLLDNADSVVVSGKMVPPAKWQKDEDGTPVTTIRAKRVTVTA
jgi:hypothetical protein